MKTIIRNVIAFAAVICLIGIIAICSSKSVSAESQSAETLTIQNTTPLELNNVKLKLNNEKTVNIGTIGGNETVTVPADVTSDPVVVTRITGENDIAGKLDTVVRGWVKSDAKIYILLDEDMSYSVTSNIEARE